MSSDEADRRRAYAELEKRGQPVPGKYFGTRMPSMKQKETPKVKVIDFHEFIEKTDTNTTTAFFKAANLVIDKLDIKNSGFRIVSNSGTNGGQEVPHFHIHILAGEKIGNLR